MTNRVVITGLGVISPIGTGKERFWESLVEGRSGIGQVTAFNVDGLPTKVAAEVHDFDPSLYLDKKEARRMDRFTQFAVATAQMAAADAGLKIEEEDPFQVGVILGCGIGGIGTIEEQHKVLLERGPGRISPFFVPMIISNMAAGQISISMGAKGPNITIVTACASSTNSVGEAFKWLQRGGAQVMIAGGTEASITPLAFSGFCSMKAMSSGSNDNPAKASRPFDLKRDGFVMGEGSGILIMETLAHAQKRGANILAEVVGYGATADAYHMTATAPGGEGAAMSMSLALADAGLKPEEIDYINAHGTSTELNDRSETDAIKKVFGEHAYKLAISSTKSMTGHLLGAAGAIELIASTLAIRNGVVPPTINYETPDPDCDLDYVPNTARQLPIRTAISNSFGFGGHNATVVIKRFEE